MPRPVSHGAFSTSWNPACAGSKLRQTATDNRKVSSDVQSAIARLLRATISSSPRRMTISTTPTRGTKVTSVSSGQSAMASPERPIEVPADQRRDADQHDEGIVVDVAGLQPHHALGRIERGVGHAVRAKAIDDADITAAPEA